MDRSVKQSGSFAAGMIVAVMLCTPGLAQEKKVTLEELIAHHLDSIGSPAARAVPKNRVVSGTVKLVSRVGGASNLEGQEAMAVGFERSFGSFSEYRGRSLTVQVHGALPVGGGRVESVNNRTPIRGACSATSFDRWTCSGSIKPRLSTGFEKIDGRQPAWSCYRPEGRAP
jgi:hypothetical protein